MKVKYRGANDMKQKHAYMVIAHNNFEQLGTLLSLLDDKRNDIFVHIDEKVRDFEKLKRELLCNVKLSSLKFIPRLRVTWGDFSLIQVEINLLKTALETGTYRYFHLLSGACIPLHSQDYIHAFFERNDGKEFVNFGTEEYIGKVVDRCRYYYFFQKEIGNSEKLRSLLLRKIRGGVIILQKIFKVNRLRKIDEKVVIAAGSNWFSITNDLANYVVRCESWIYDTFHCGICVDELFLQTIVFNSPFYKKCYISTLANGVKGNVRLIDWERGAPYVWRAYDLEELMQSDCMFARKFDEYVDNQVIEDIRKEVSNENFITG